ncbi:MAG: tetratricopeptide repeat protein, partial [Kiritimatiellales bacterium]
MHKRKDEIRDIYQGSERDFEKDFTPQVAQEIAEHRQRDLRRIRIFSTFFGVLAVVLAIVLVSLVARDFLSERAPSRKIRTAESPYISQFSLPADALWVMDYQNMELPVAANEKPGSKALSTKWIKNAAYHIIMGQQALTFNQPDEALEHFNRVVEIYPDITDLHQAVGALYLQRSDYALAAAHLEKAVQEEETFGAVNNLGTAYIGTKEYDKAEKYLKRSLELQPENPECYKNLAVLYRKMNRDNDAVYSYEKYIDLRPNDLDTMQTYALYLT